MFRIQREYKLIKTVYLSYAIKILQFNLKFFIESKSLEICFITFENNLLPLTNTFINFCAYALLNFSILFSCSVSAHSCGKLAKSYENIFLHNEADKL